MPGFDSLRVLFVVRPDASARYGGDITLARQTCEAVRALGVSADFVETDEPQARGYDVAHIFNVGQPDVCKRQMDACRRARVPVALSPVWLDLREFFGRAQVYERLFRTAPSHRSVQAKLRRYRILDAEHFLRARERQHYRRRLAAQRELLEQAEVLLPNSAIEARDCLVQLGVRDKPFVIPYIAAELGPSQYWQDNRRGLVSLGRVETRKNQTGLAYALRSEAMDVDIVGAIYDPGIVDICTKWCPRARFHDRLAREQVLQVLGRAEVHALVSWCETAGIATFEAAAAGAKIVVADRGAEVEYFGDDAEYANPADPESICAAVRRAFARPPRRRGDSLDLRIRRRSWHDAALETVRAYRIALGAEGAPTRAPMPAGL
jgi:glycosyltransferase involved in cell wall biosynthesis